VKALFFAGALLVAAPQVAAAQASVQVSVTNETGLPIKAVNNTIQGRWGQFDTAPSTTSLQFSAQGSSSWVGVSGSVTLRTENGEPVGTLSFNFPWVGDDTITLSCNPPFYGYVDYQEVFSRDHRITVLLQRQRKATTTLNLPTTGPGIVRGRLSWDPSRVTAKNGQAMAEAVKRFLAIKAKAPSVFYEVDPATAPKQSYQGRAGGYDNIVAVGQLRWLASDSRGIGFELYDLPTDVPLYLKAVTLADPKNLFQNGPGEAAPSPTLMFPPAKSAPTFSVRIDTASPFRGPLEPGNPLYPNYNLSLEPVWQSEGGDGGGTSSIDPVTARLRSAALSRINPSPLWVRDRASVTAPRTIVAPVNATTGRVKIKR